MSTAILITMAGLGVTSAVAQKILDAFGKGNYGQMLDIAGISGVSLAALTAVIKVLNTMKSL